jgi:hypothetical protein
MTQDRWHNLLGSFADWDKIGADFASLHQTAEEAGFNLTIVDDQCPCCGFRPAVRMTERKVKQDKQP